MLLSSVFRGANFLIGVFCFCVFFDQYDCFRVVRYVF
jgi:hypothetical protein